MRSLSKASLKIAFGSIGSCTPFQSTWDVSCPCAIEPSLAAKLIVVVNVPLPRELAVTLRALRPAGAVDDALVFPGRDGAPAACAAACWYPLPSGLASQASAFTRCATRAPRC